MEGPRVALFTDTLDETNGVANTYNRMLRNAEASGRRLDVYCPSLTGEDTVTESGTTRVMRFRPHLAIRYYEHLQFSFFPNPRIDRAFQEFGPYDLVQAAAPGNLGIAGRILMRRHKLAGIAVHHTQLQDYAAEFLGPAVAEPARLLSIQILAGFYRGFDRVLCTTPAMEAHVREIGLAERTGIFSRGVDTEAFSPAMRRREAGGPIRLLYAGRVSPEKNLRLLMEVADRLRRRHEIEVVIAGDGIIREELEAAYPWARFLGYVRGADLAQAYADADVFAFPSLTDTFGNVIQEAMASGVPAVVMDPRGPGEIVEASGAGLIGTDEAAFEAALERLISGAEFRIRLGIQARQYAESRSWDRVFDELWSTYAETVAEHRARRNPALPA